MKNNFFNVLEKTFSNSRMNPYLRRCSGCEERAAALYQHNISLSRSLYPILNYVEVALRNTISECLKKHFRNEDWYISLANKYPELGDAISKAEEKKRKQRKAQDIVAHFTLSFWVGLFNGKYAHDLWKPLRLAFPKMPKDKKKRANISNPLNRFRHIRNRVSHHEPICFDLDGLKNLYDEMKELLSWIDPELVILLKQIDNFEVAYNETKAIIL